MRTKLDKRQVGIRIPAELDEQLENHIKKIGISRASFILQLIYNELSRLKMQGKQGNE